MVYKLFLRGLRRNITKSIELEREFSEKSTSGICDENCMKSYLHDLSDNNMWLTSELENIEKHYKNMSLFIETLFRQSHFDQGRLIPRTKSCNMKKDVVLPQLDRFIDRFKQYGISTDDRLSNIPEEEIISVVDVGLIAQVYANFFSNALKYTEEITDEANKKKKYISYGHEIIKDFFGPDKDGVKYNVFSTGRHLSEVDRYRVYDEEYRGVNVSTQPGTGHGLSFIKNAIEIHDGIVGYEPTKHGNNFYFVLPK